MDTSMQLTHTGIRARTILGSDTVVAMTRSIGRAGVGKCRAVCAEDLLVLCFLFECSSCEEEEPCVFDICTIPTDAKGIVLSKISRSGRLRLSKFARADTRSKVSRFPSVVGSSIIRCKSCLDSSAT